MRIIASLALHGLAAAEFYPYCFCHTMLCQPRMDAYLALRYWNAPCAWLICWLKSEPAMKYFRKHLRKSAVRRLVGMAALGGIIPYSVQVRRDVVSLLQCPQTGELTRSEGSSAAGFSRRTCSAWIPIFRSRKLTLLAGWTG